jgi:hypothetical protein
VPKEAITVLDHIAGGLAMGTGYPPPMTYSEMRHLAAQLPPGARYRRHLLWRYSLTWTKPLSRPTVCGITHEAQRSAGTLAALVFGFPVGVHRLA